MASRRTPTLRSVLAGLRAASRPDQLEAMARFGLGGRRRLAVPIPVMRKMARELGTNHELARRLQRTGIPDAQILASLIGDPVMMTPAEMHRWARDFQAWDVCDQTCLNLFARSPRAWTMVHRLSNGKEEYVKRSAFALLACLAVHDRTAPSDRFIAALDLVRRAGGDDRPYVKKGVSWALRAIGKRRPRLRKAAISAAKELHARGGPARWIAADVLRELRTRA